MKWTPRRLEAGVAVFTSFIRMSPVVVSPTPRASEVAARYSILAWRWRRPDRAEPVPVVDVVSLPAAVVPD